MKPVSEIIGIKATPFAAIVLSITMLDFITPALKIVLMLLSIAYTIDSWHIKRQSGTTGFQPVPFRKILLWVAVAAAVLIIAMILDGCASVQKSKEVERTEIRKDSVSVSKASEKVEVSKAVDDRLELSIGTVRTGIPNCDSVAQLAVEDAMKRISIDKTSGDNSYQLKWNDERKSLMFQLKMAQTQNRTRSDSTSSSSKAREKYYVNHYKKVVVRQPWWMYILGVALIWIATAIVRRFYLKINSK